MSKNISIQRKSFLDMRFDSIQTLRALASLLVVAEHIRFLGCGAFGVDIFFCISGFMIMFTTEKGTEYFLRKRIIRIVPFYYLMTFGTFALLVLFPSMFAQTQASMVQLIKSLLFIPFDVGGGVLQPILRVGWTINCEMFFYLIFWAASHISHKYRGLICSGFMALIVTGSSILSGSNFLTDFLTNTVGNEAAANWMAPVLFYGNPVMLEFVLGILCYYAAQKIYEKNSRVSEAIGSEVLRFGGKCIAFICLMEAVLLIIVLIITRTSVNMGGFGRFLYWGLPSFVIVLAFFVAGLYIRMPEWTVKLGNISFSVYLVHYYPLLFIDRKICDFSTYSLSAVVGVILTLGMIILVSYAAWYIMEKRLTGWLRKRVVPAVES